MKCENHIPSIGAYFLRGMRTSVRCSRDAEWEVAVNPPRADSDGKLRLCALCYKWDYSTFPIAAEIGRNSPDDSRAQNYRADR